MISLKSAAEMKRWLEAAGHQCHTVLVRGDQWKVVAGKQELDLDKNTISFEQDGQSYSFDFVWNMIHGTPGEDGKLQGFLDMVGMAYAGSGHFASALSFNKYASKTYLKQHQILTAKARLIRQGGQVDLEELGEYVGFPCFVKPNSGGSSFGIAKVSKSEDLATAIELALKEDLEVIVERYVKGTEVTCGLYRKNGDFRVFPVTEIVTQNEFFDYEAKYTQGMAREITPARLDEGLARKCQDLACEIYELSNCAGLARVDFIIKGNQVYFLELNSIPGMSRESIVPQQIEAAGMKVEEVLQEIILDALGKGASS